MKVLTLSFDSVDLNIQFPLSGSFPIKERVNLFDRRLDIKLQTDTTTATLAGQHVDHGVKAELQTIRVGHDTENIQ